MDSMKYEIANEFGVDLGPDFSSRCNNEERNDRNDMNRSKKNKKSR